MSRSKRDYRSSWTHGRVQAAGFGWNAPLWGLHTWVLHAVFAVLLVPFVATIALAQTEQSASLTLPQAIQFALKHSPDLQTATAEIRKQEGNVKSGQSPLLPQVDLLADASRYRFDHGILPGADPRNLHFDNMIYTTGGTAFAGLGLRQNLSAASSHSPAA